jgi:hypothetical protein
MMIQRAATTLARLYETRSEMILKSDDVEMMRECVQSAAWMGMPADHFRRKVIEYSQTIVSGNAIGTDIEWHALDRLFQELVDIKPR